MYNKYRNAHILRELSVWSHMISGQFIDKQDIHSFGGKRNFLE